MLQYVGDINGEEWVEIEGYAGMYAVSNMGRVMSLGRRGNNKKMILPGTDDTDGYLRVTLRVDGKQYTEKVHQLVLKAFVPNPNNYPEINHKYCDKHDNRVSSLEWSSVSNNKKHAYKNGLMKSRKEGENNLSRMVAKFDGEKLVKKYFSLSAASKDGCTTYGICQAIKRNGKHRGFKWKYLD